MKATEQHKKYVNDLNSLMDNSGKEMSNFAIKAFKTALKSNADPASFVKSIQTIKPHVMQAMRTKAMQTAKQSFDLGKKFASEKKKK